uniref:Serpentine receptor class gamma n=1 Tax=Panagrolaimus davidi TaxID=227884 RepID=A0A914NZ53_9BILA
MGRWYYSFEVGIWNLFLAMNRATALIFPVKYERYWSYKKLFIYIILILAYPFIVDSYSFFDECRFKVYSSKCRQFRLTDQWFAAVLTSVKAILAVGFTIFALWKARKRGSMASSKIETRLTLQTLSASILLIAFSLCELLAVLYYDPEDNDLYYLFNSLSDLLYSLYYYPVIVIMFVVW